jgi:hypothetical protein
MSENEKLDDQMRNGTDYVNLPAHMFPTDQAPTWIRKLELALTPNQSTSVPKFSVPAQVRILPDGLGLDPQKIFYTRTESN